MKKKLKWFERSGQGHGGQWKDEVAIVAELPICAVYAKVDICQGKVVASVQSSVDGGSCILAYKEFVKLDAAKAWCERMAVLKMSQTVKKIERLI
jgi:hypothetical protein